MRPLAKVTGRLLLAASLLGGASAWACGKPHERPKLSAEVTAKLHAAISAHKSGDCKEATRLLEGGHALDARIKDDYWAIRVEGTCAYQAGDFAGAREKLLHAAEVFETDPDVLAKLGVSEWHVGKVKDSAKRLGALEKVGRLKDPRGAEALARARLKLKDKKGAVAALELGLKRNPDDGGLKALKVELQGS